MKNYEDWLSAYFTYAKDGFCPDRFHFWTGVSVVAGALERKVWINQKGRHTFPNLYCFLIAHPGEGKSTASDIGVFDFLRALKTPEGKDSISVLPAQMSDAYFAQKMAHRSKFYVGAQELIQCSHYFYISEASNSLKELSGGGELTAALTDFYDCPRKWVKGTVGKGEVIAENLCCNALVGCTFSYLKEMFPDERIMGGFASRILYVAAKETKTRYAKWEPDGRNPLTRDKLLDDLQMINNLKGQFTVTPEYGATFEDWFPKHDAARRSMKSEREQAFMARKHTNILKLSMVCAASEHTLRLEKKHWERALEIYAEVESGLGLILDSAATPDTQLGVTHILKMLIRRGGGSITTRGLNSGLLAQGVPKEVAEHTLSQLMAAGEIHVQGASYYLNPDANNNL